MAPKIKVDLSESGCVKPACKRKWGPTHRHHIRSEFAFVRRWSLDPKRMKHKKYRDFVNRYWEFRPSDIARLCPHHHAEIHMEYDEIIMLSNMMLKKGIFEYTWEEAQALMKELKATFKKWVKKETPGVNPDLRLGTLDLD